MNGIRHDFAIAKEMKAATRGGGETVKDWLAVWVLGVGDAKSLTVRLTV